MHTKDRLTLDQLRAEQCYIELTPKQKKMVDHFIISNGDRVASVMAAYATKSEANARVLAYEFFASPRVVACLAAYFQNDPFEDFKAEVRKAYRNKKLTVAQVSALKLHADLNGWGSALLPDQHGRDAAKPDEPAATEKAPTLPANAGPQRFKIGDRVTERDDQGILHIGRVTAVDSDGQVLDAEEIIA
jgi:hypothetical protein